MDIDKQIKDLQVEIEQLIDKIQKKKKQINKLEKKKKKESDDFVHVECFVCDGVGWRDKNGDKLVCPKCDGDGSYWARRA